MKRLLYVCAAALLSCNACSTPEGYAIRGNFPGLQDGITVTLRSLEGDMPQILAQDTVQNGQFELRGYTPSPVYCDLTINNKSYGAVSQIALNKGTYLFLDNSEMQMEAPHFDSLAFISPTYSEIENPDVKITGGALQAEYIAYRQALYPYEQKAKMPGDSLSIYFFKYNMQQCPREEYVKKYDYFYPIKASAERQMDSVRMAFIRQHPTSPLSLYLAEKLLNTNFIRTQAEVEQKDLDVSLYTLNERVNQLFFGILLTDARLEQYQVLQAELQRHCTQVTSYINNGIANQADLDALHVELLKA